jgi:peptidoglycan/xylan/chitin deacetylase (PgdA/CDA1 family)
VRFIFPLAVVLFLLVAIMFTTGRSPVAAFGGLAGATTPQIWLPADMPTPTPKPLPPPPFASAPDGQRPYVPILMYHYVRTVDASVDPLGYGLSVTPAQFAAQLDWLHRAGYDTVQLSALVSCVHGEAPCPARAVALTFDDGYMDAYTNAFPLLQQYGDTATFYIVSGFVGHEGYMGWDEIRAMHNAGMEIGAHSISHLDLTTLSYYENVDQIARSGQEIAAQIGAPVRSFCYPAGKFTPEIAKITHDAGYTSATTTIQEGAQEDMFTLPRIRIAGDLSQEGFEATVAAYAP